MDLTYEFLLQPNVKSDAYFIGSSYLLARCRRASARQAAPSYLVEKNRSILQLRTVFAHNAYNT
jgi:hypothetical protein